MKYTTAFITFASAMSATTATVIASPTLQDSPSKVKRSDCTATLSGSNSEGGGGPGQEPIDNNQWGLAISGGTTAYGFEDMNQSEQNVSLSVSAADYGGSGDIMCSGTWEFIGNYWTDCNCMFAPGQYSPGAVQEQNIDSGTVSVTTDDCIVLFPNC